MSRRLITSLVSLLLLVALVVLVETVSTQGAGLPIVEPVVVTVTPEPTPSGPLTIRVTAPDGAESIDDVWAVITIPAE